MMESISARQMQILGLMLEHKSGLSIDEMADLLSISRNAVQQHFSKLERDGYVEMGALNKTAGRPVRSFVLTETGLNCFPKQYSWFSELILDDLKARMGSESLQQYFADLAQALVAKQLPELASKPGELRQAELVELMNHLGFQAKLIEEQTPATQSIVASNCIYHDLAQKHVEICQFDRTLITALLGKEIDHVQCMARGGAVCKFRIKPQTQ